MSELNYSCLKWDKEDIKAAAAQVSDTKLTDEQAEELLQAFFDENDEHIIETINIALIQFCLHELDNIKKTQLKE